jgi:curli production assembly/transport component CsgG
VFIRLVSVSTGEVLLSQGVQKTIWSYKVDGTLFRYVDIGGVKGPKLLEGELGAAANEPTNFATKAAIEQCIVEMIKQGEQKGLWQYKPKE